MNVRTSIGTYLPPDKMEKILMLGRDGDEDKGTTGRGRSGNNGTAHNNNNDDDNHCNDGLRYVRLSLSDTHFANKIPCNLLPPPPQPPPQRFLPGPWTHYFKIRKNLPNFLLYFTSCVTSKNILKVFSRMFHSRPRTCGPHGNPCTT